MLVNAGTLKAIFVNLSWILHFHAQSRDAVLDLLDILSASKCRQNILRCDAHHVLQSR